MIAVLAIHELGHMAGGVCAGFRFFGLQIGPVQFDRQFRPNRASAARWKSLWLAYRLGEPVPPVSVYRVDGRDWLYDGHHRVSTLRHQGAATVDAHVTEWR